jgi:hypothetical protein
MKKGICLVLLGMFLMGVTALAVGVVGAQGPVAREAGEHPNIAKAIEALEVAIGDMQRAPHDFGGHKAKAIEASQRAIKQLKLALAYRAQEDKPRHP